MENIVGEPAYHSEECELFEVESGFTKQDSRGKIYSRVGSKGMEFNEILKILHNRVSYNVGYIIPQD